MQFNADPEVMIVERLDHLAQAAGGMLLSGRPETMIHGLFSDTRSPVKGGLFVALRGDRFDGNLFAREAVEKHGAAAVMLDRPEAARGLPAHIPTILVNDTREGYLGIAAQHRQQLKGVVWLGVTGSVGKSTTKEMMAHILERGAGWAIHKAKGSFNNAIGLSHTILAVRPVHRAAVLELGTNHPGEIAQLSRVARPNIAVITCAAESHLEAFETVANVAREKAHILDFQSADDTAVINADDPHFPLWKSIVRGRVVSFGTNPEATVKAKHVRLNASGFAEFMVRCGDALADCVLKVPGLFQVNNALAAVAAAMAAGIPLADAVRSIRSFEGVSRRFAVRERNGITLIDDAYNANPASFRAALDTLKGYPNPRRLVVAGDMLELGPQSEALHRELGRLMAEANLSALVTVGALASLIGEVAVAHGLPASAWTHCDSPDAAAHALKPQLRSGDAVLVKGSHGLHLDRCCELLFA